MDDRDRDDVGALTRVALGLLGRRPLTENELRGRLERLGHPPTAIDAACARLRDAGYVDDRRLAHDFIVARAERLGHGPRRLVEQLCRRGVEREIAAAALRQAVEQGDLAPRELLRRRLHRQLRGASAPLEPRELARVYNALRRAGFSEEAIRQELDPYRGPVSHDEPTADESTDDFP